MNMHTMAVIVNTAQYIGLGLGVIFFATLLFVWLTPYDDFKEIREGKVAPAIALRGAMFGFTAPVLVMSYFGVNIYDFVLWASIASVMQLLLFVVVDKIMTRKQPDNVAVAKTYESIAIVVGLVTAVSLIPH